jgi:hypothetical protein
MLPWWKPCVISIFPSSCGTPIRKVLCREITVVKCGRHVASSRNVKRLPARNDLEWHDMPGLGCRLPRT